jgi:hypothetical protein
MLLDTGGNYARALCTYAGAGVFLCKVKGAWGMKLSLIGWREDESIYLLLSCLRTDADAVLGFLPNGKGMVSVGCTPLFLWDVDWI